VLTPNQFGPAVSPAYPLSYYVEDYEFVNGLGKLDQYNGRFYPNPFNPTTIIRFSVSVGTRHGVSLQVFDVLGREVALLVNGNLEAGEHAVESPIIPVEFMVWNCVY